MTYHQVHRLRRIRSIRQLVGIVAAIVASAGLAHAHGGMAGPDELGPPLFTSAVLAFLCYWVVILWPVSKRKGTPDTPPGKKQLERESRASARRSYRRETTGGNAQLRKIESIRARATSDVERKASDA